MRRYIHTNYVTYLCTTKRGNKTMTMKNRYIFTYAQCTYILHIIRCFRNCVLHNTYIDPLLTLIARDGCNQTINIWKPLKVEFWHIKSSERKPSLSLFIFDLFLILSYDPPSLSWTTLWLWLECHMCYTYIFSENLSRGL